MVIGIGTDLVRVDAVRKMLDLDGGHDPSIARDFTEAERATCLARVDPAQGLAARLAAKNAVLSALGSPASCRRVDVEVVRQSSGKPELVLHGAVRDAADAVGITRAHVTLTHSDSHALAVVLLEAIG